MDSLLILPGSLQKGYSLPQKMRQGQHHEMLSLLQETVGALEVDQSHELALENLSKPSLQKRKKM
jgi:hypothetical protein